MYKVFLLTMNEFSISLPEQSALLMNHIAKLTLTERKMQILSHILDEIGAFNDEMTFSCVTTTIHITLSTAQ